LLSSPGRRNTSSTAPSATLRRTGSPASANTRSIALFSSSVVAPNAVSPRRRASDTRCSSSSVAMPRWCMSSDTAKATSAVPGIVVGS
jgi:hypothetical protein